MEKMRRGEAHVGGGGEERRERREERIDRRGDSGEEKKNGKTRSILAACLYLPLSLFLSFSLSSSLLLRIKHLPAPSELHGPWAPELQLHS